MKVLREFAVAAEEGVSIVSRVRLRANALRLRLRNSVSAGAAQTAASTLAPLFAFNGEEEAIAKCI